MFTKWCINAPPLSGQWEPPNLVEEVGAGPQNFLMGLKGHRSNLQGVTQRIGLREHVQEILRFNGKIYGFLVSCRFSLKPIHWLTLPATPARTISGGFFPLSPGGWFEVVFKSSSHRARSRKVGPSVSDIRYLGWCSPPVPTRIWPSSALVQENLQTTWKTHSGLWPQHTPA